MIQKIYRLEILVVALALCAALAGCSDDDDVDGDPDTGVSDTDVAETDVAEHDADDGGLPDAGDAGEPDTDGPPPECPMTFQEAGQARVFTFGSKISTDVADSYDSYEAYFRDQVREIADCMSDDRPNLLLFPEDAGLHAGLIGSRGEAARDATDAEQAFLQLLLAYDEPIDWVVDQHDDLETPRRIFLGLTDTLWRAMDQTFSGIADDYDAWVLTSGNVAEIEESTDPEMIDIWADPDLEEVESVFIPAGEEVFNSAIIYDPDGQLVSRVHKPYLTQTEEEELALSYGPVDSLRPVEVGPELFGVFTSKDAWMPPINDRLGLLGSTLQVQPEAFSGWTITHLDEQEEWLPDVLTQSGWAAVQKYPSYRYGAMPVLTGNFVEMVFDGQAVVWGQVHPGVEWGGFVGQFDRPGFLEVGPWAFDDPGDDVPELTMDERRAELRELGEALLPGAGDPHENAYIDSVVGRDLLGGLDYTEGDDDRSVPLDIVDVTAATEDSSPKGSIQRARLAADDGRLAISWQEQSAADGPYQLRTTLWEWSDDAAEYEFLSGSTTAESDGQVIAPAIAFLSDGGLLRVAQKVDETSSELRASVSTEDGESAQSVPLPYIEAEQDAWLADVAVDGDRVVATYTSGLTGHDRVFVTTSDDGGETFAESAPIEEFAAVEPPNTRGNQWHPAVDVRGDTIVVAWTDFRAFQWELYGTFSLDGGESWADIRRIDDAGDGYERLHTDPRVVLVDGDEAIVSWTYQADRRPDSDARLRRWDLSEDSLEDSSTLDRDDETYPTHSWLPRVKPVGEQGELAAAWMELRGETSVIVADIPGFDEPVTVSHPGRVAWWPDLTVDGERIIITWVEHGPEQGFRLKAAFASISE